MSDGGREELRVPKDKQIINVHLVDGEKLDGAIFLDHYPEDVLVYQKVIALLEEKTLFLPVVPISGSVEFVNKNCISMIECNCPIPPEDTITMSLMHMENIKAVFYDGSTATGSLLAEVPPDNSRLSDCLNVPHRFLPLKINETLFYLVNKDLLKKVMYAARKK